MIRHTKDSDLKTVLQIMGTVTIKDNVVNRLFVLPEFQSHGFQYVSGI